MIYTADYDEATGIPSVSPTSVPGSFLPFSKVSKRISCSSKQLDTCVRQKPLSLLKQCVPLLPTDGAGRGLECEPQVVPSGERCSGYCVLSSAALLQSLKCSTAFYYYRERKDNATSFDDIIQQTTG